MARPLRSSEPGSPSAPSMRPLLKVVLGAAFGLVALAATLTYLLVRLMSR